MTTEQEIRTKALEIAILIHGGKEIGFAQDNRLPAVLDFYRPLASEIEAYIREAPPEEKSASNQ